VITAFVYAPLAVDQLPKAFPPAQVLLAVGILGVVCTALAFLLFFALIAEVGPVRATVITYFNPAVALLLGVLLLKEPFTLGAVIGFALILSGSLLATRRVSSRAAGEAEMKRQSPSASARPGRSEPLRRSQGSGR
jgi:drug/metabolite transporter (DMT)-like permease